MFHHSGHTQILRKRAMRAEIKKSIYSISDSLTNALLFCIDFRVSVCAHVCLGRISHGVCCEQGKLNPLPELPSLLSNNLHIKTFQERKHAEIPRMKRYQELLDTSQRASWKSVEHDTKHSATPMWHDSHRRSACESLLSENSPKFREQGQP